jgi:hypothetical protein
VLLASPQCSLHLPALSTARHPFILHWRTKQVDCFITSILANGKASKIKFARPPPWKGSAHRG